MLAKQNISRYLLFCVASLFVLLGAGIYFLLTSEKMTSWLVAEAISRFVNNSKLHVETAGINGSLLTGIDTDFIKIKHVMPNLEARINKFSLGFSYDNIKKGIVGISASIDSIEAIGQFRLNPAVASVPEFIGPICMAAMPSNLQFQKIDVGKVCVYPYPDKSLKLYSSKIALKTNVGNIASVTVEVNADWKQKPFAKAVFDGSFDNAKNKISGFVKLDIAKQHIESELSIVNGKKNTEFSGYLASATVIDLLPLSQWLGGMWQIDYPYAVSGRLTGEGSWLYNDSVGFMGNLTGRYQKLDVSFVGGLFSILELNGEWKLFDGALALNDSGSRLAGFPATLNGKIEEIATKNRKWNLCFNCDDLQLEKVTMALPWVIKYSNGIPDLTGGVSVSSEFVGNRPMINAKVVLKDLKQLDAGKNLTGTSGKLNYILSETGSANVNGQLAVGSKSCMPVFFKRFSNGRLFASENLNGIANNYLYTISGSTDTKLKLNGSLKTVDNTIFETVGELIDGRLYLKANKKENRVYELNAADPVDLLLMR